MQCRQKFSGSMTKKFEQEVCLYIPALHGKLPMILDLHGAGERGSNLSYVENSLLVRIKCQHDKFPFVVVTPQCEAGNIWSPDKLHVLTKEVQKKYKFIDIDRTYVMGYSMGARGTWDLICEHPDTYAAAVPMGGFACYLRAPRISHMAIWAIHGGGDTVVPSDEAEKIVGAIQREADSLSQAKMTITDGGGHGIFGAVYAHDPIYDWMLSHKLSSAMLRKTQIKKMSEERYAKFLEEQRSEALKELAKTN